MTPVVADWAKGRARLGMVESDQTSDQSDQSELLPQAEARSEKEQGFTVK